MCLNILNPHYPHTVQGHWRQKDKISWPFYFSRASRFYFFSIHLKTSQPFVLSVWAPCPPSMGQSLGPAPWSGGAPGRCSETCREDPTPGHLRKPNHFLLVIITAPWDTALQVPLPPPLHGPQSKPKHRPIPFLLELLRSPRWCLGD